MTFNEGKTEIEALVKEALSEREPEDRFLGSVGCERILAILASIEQPSENDMAVLWLMKEKGWETQWFGFQWQVRKQQATGRFYCTFNPADEAKDMGWKP